jgi:multicomponent Na+:H+ antiporter subunit E
MLIWNLLLAALWAIATEWFTLGNCVVGFALGFLAIVTFGRPLGGDVYLRRTTAIVGLTAFFLKELVVANLKMAYYTVMPLNRLRPGIVAVPLEEMSDGALTLLANLITLTPGTLSVDVGDDRRTLYVHTMYVEKPEDLIREIKEGFEPRVLRILR